MTDEIDINTEPDDLRRQLAAQTERADYAWRNVGILEKAYQAELAKRDAIQAILRQLITEADDNPFTTVGHFVEHITPRCREHA